MSHIVTLRSNLDIGRPPESSLPHAPTILTYRIIRILSNKEIAATLNH